jgi:hypothetical protein
MVKLMKPIPGNPSIYEKFSDSAKYGGGGRLTREKIRIFVTNCRFSLNI